MLKLQDHHHPDLHHHHTVRDHPHEGFLSATTTTTILKESRIISSEIALRDAQTNLQHYLRLINVEHDS